MQKNQSLLKHAVWPFNSSAFRLSSFVFFVIFVVFVFLFPMLPAAPDRADAIPTQTGTSTSIAGEYDPLS